MLTNQTSTTSIENKKEEVPYGTIYGSFGVAGDGFGMGADLIFGRRVLMSIGIEAADDNILFEIGFGFNLFKKRLIFLGGYGIGSDITTSYDAQILYKTNNVAFGIGYTKIDDYYSYFKLGIGYSF